MYMPGPLHLLTHAVPKDDYCEGRRGLDDERPHLKQQPAVKVHILLTVSNVPYADFFKIFLTELKAELPPKRKALLGTRSTSIAVSWGFTFPLFAPAANSCTEHSMIRTWAVGNRL